MLFRKLIEKKLTKHIHKKYNEDGYFEIQSMHKEFYDKITIYKVRFGYYKVGCGYVDFEKDVETLNIQFLKGVIYSCIEE